jgi:hypothetical protein
MCCVPKKEGLLFQKKSLLYYVNNILPLANTPFIAPDPVKLPYWTRSKVGEYLRGKQSKSRGEFCLSGREVALEM